MDHKVLAISPRLVAKFPCRTQVGARPTLASWLLPALQHPALSYAAEHASIHHSLDLSFQRAITISLLDRQLIDNLKRIRQPLQYAELLASGF